MKQDQNRIELRLNTAKYDECILRSNEGTFVKPGSLLIFEEDPLTARGYSNFNYSAKTRVLVTERIVADAFGYPVLDENGDYVKPPVDENGELIDPSDNVVYYRDDYRFDSNGSLQHNRQAPYARTSYVSYSTYADDSSVADEVAEHNIPVEETKTTPQDRFPVAVVLENALFGKALNHDAVVGEVTPVRYLTETNEVLLRAVPGQYYYGDVVYAVQTLNDGIWVASETTLGSGISAGILGGSAALGMKVGICQEDYRVTPQMCMISDTTGPEDPTGYTPANKDMGSGDDWVRWGAQAIPFHSTKERNSFYYEGSSSSRYFGGVLVNLIKVRTTAFYAETTPLPKIQASVSPRRKSWDYNGNASTLTSLFTISGKQSGDTVTYAVKSPSAYSTASSIKDAGVYEVEVKISRDGYQTFTHRETFTITKKAVSVSGTTVQDKTFDGTTLAVIDTLGTVSGILSGDRNNVSVTASGVFDNATPGMMHTVTVTYALTGSAAKNYYLATPTEEVEDVAIFRGSTGDDELPEIEGISINPAHLGYNGREHNMAEELVTYNNIIGLESGDVVTCDYNGSATIKDAGTYYPVHLTVQREGYKDYETDITQIIIQSIILINSITSVPKVRVPGDTSAEITYTASGIYDGFSLEYTANFNDDEPSLVEGDKTVAVDFRIPSEYTSNYMLVKTHYETTGTILSSQEGGLPEIEARIEGSSITYNGEDINVESLILTTGTEPTDTVTYNPVTVKNTGTYPIAVEISRDGYETWTGTVDVVVTPAPLGVSGTTVDDKVYDGTTTATVNRGTISGVRGEDSVSVSAYAEFPSSSAGSYSVSVVYEITGADAGNYIVPETETTQATIIQSQIAVSGTVVADKAYDGTRSATVTLGAVSGIVGGDDVTVTALASFPSAEAGTYDVTVVYSITGADADNYIVPVSTTVRATITGQTVAAMTYTPTQNGGATTTTTEIRALFMCSDTSRIPESIPYSAITVGGDAVLAKDAGNCVLSNNIATIPIRVIPKASNDDSAYMATIRIDSGNSDTGVKNVPIHFMAGYWGCYPCQLGDSDIPTASQIVNSEGRNVLTGAKVASVSCTFALNSADWNNEVSANGITGEDADINESGCGYEYFVTCWDTSVGVIMNEANIPQNNAFNSFTVTINGVEYRGVVSKNCELPSGSSPFTFSLS